MDAVFYIAAAVAIVATIMVITRLNAVHALLYLIVSLLSVAVAFYTLGAPFIAALEAIIYAGAIMVLFVFVVMMLNLGTKTMDTERTWLRPRMWMGPCILTAILIAEVAYLLFKAGAATQGAAAVVPKQVGAYHLGVGKRERLETQDVIDSDATRTAFGGNPVCPGARGSSRAA
jgi:NADH-quinone oxidoreductase subunit J